MAQNIKLEIVTPERIVIDEEVQIIMAPGVLGEFGVLSGHTPFLTSLKVGTISYKDLNGAKKYIFVNEGFAEALPDKVTVLAQSSESKDYIDIDRAKKAKERAEKRLDSSNTEDIDYERAKAALYRAIQRINIVENI